MRSVAGAGEQAALPAIRRVAKLPPSAKDVKRAGSIVLFFLARTHPLGVQDEYFPARTR